MTPGMNRLAFLGRYFLDLVVARLIEERNAGDWTPQQQLAVASVATSSVACAWMSRRLGLARRGSFRYGNDKGGRAIDRALEHFATCSDAQDLLWTESQWTALNESGVPGFLTDLFHSLVGAVFVDSDFCKAHQVIGDFVASEVDGAARVKDQDWLYPMDTMQKCFRSLGYGEMGRAKLCIERVTPSSFNCCDRHWEDGTRMQDEDWAEWGKAELRQLREELSVVTDTPTKPAEFGSHLVPFFVQQGAKDFLDQSDVVVVDVLYVDTQGQQVRLLRTSSTAEDSALFAAATAMLECPELRALSPSLTAKEVEVQKDLMTRQRRNRNSRVNDHRRVTTSNGDQELQLALPDQKWTAEQMDAMHCSQQVFECLLCGVSLNGKNQYEDHLVGKKHKKHEEAARAFHSPVNGAPPAVSPVVPPGHHALALGHFDDFDIGGDDSQRPSGWTQLYEPSYAAIMPYSAHHLDASRLNSDSEQRNTAPADLIAQVQLIDEVEVLLKLQEAVNARLARLRPRTDAERWLDDGAHSRTMAS